MFLNTNLLLFLRVDQQSVSKDDGDKDGLKSKHNNQTKWGVIKKDKFFSFSFHPICFLCNSCYFLSSVTGTDRFDNTLNDCQQWWEFKKKCVLLILDETWFKRISVRSSSFLFLNIFLIVLILLLVCLLNHHEELGNLVGGGEGGGKKEKEEEEEDEGREEQRKKTQVSSSSSSSLFSF